MMDNTIADSLLASDPPSSLPDPDEDSFGSLFGRRRAVTKHIERLYNPLSGPGGTRFLTGKVPGAVCAATARRKPTCL